MNQETKNWLKLIKFIQRQNISVRLAINNTKIDKTTNIYDQVHGVYFQLGKPTIIICGSKHISKDIYSAILIHEYGHFLSSQHIQWKNYGFDYYIVEEMLAWEVGYNNVPKELIPKCFNKIKQFGCKRNKQKYHKWLINRKVSQ